MSGAALARAKLLALLGAVALLVFGPGVVGAFVWDDHGLIVTNAWLHDLANLPRLLRSDFWSISADSETGESLARAYWRPVVTLAYALEYRLFGAEPLGYHLVNLALHVACSLLAWGFVRRRLAGDDAHRDLAATAGALVFVAHPSRPETVTWISGSTDLWMTLWVLLAARVLDGGRARRGLVAGLFCALGLLSKEAAVVAPLLLVADGWLLPASAARRREAWTAAAVAACALALRVAMAPPRRLASGVVGAAETLQRAASSLGWYVAETLWPWSPSVQVGYRAWDAAGRPLYAAWSVALGAVTALAFVALAAAARRAARWRAPLADALWFLAPLGLVLNVVDLGLDVLVASRFLYLPMLGVAALVARGVARALAGAGRSRVAALGAVGAAVAAMAVTSIGHVGHFITEEDLWTHEVSVNPRNPYAHGELARVRRGQGRVDEAVRLYARGVAAARAIHHRFHDNELVMKLAATAMLATPDHDQEALVRFRDFFDAVDRGAPGPIPLEVPGVRVSLRWNDAERAARRRLFQYGVLRAVVHARTLSLAEAERQLVAVVRATPDAWLAWQNLALVYVASDRWGDAERVAGEAARRNPGSAGARALLGAITSERAAVERHAPGSPEREIAQCAALVELRLSEAARRRLDRVMAREPRRADAARLRARVEVEAGRPAEAEAVLRAARARGVPGV